MEIKTSVFTTSPTRYLKHVIKQKFIVTILIMSCIIGICLPISFFDLRWLFISLILIFIIVPILIFNAYFFYLLSPEAVKSVGMKRVIFNSDKNIIIEFFHVDDSGDKIPTGKKEIIPFSSIKELIHADRELILNLKNGRPGFILIPKDTLTNENLIKIAEILPKS